MHRTLVLVAIAACSRPGPAPRPGFAAIAQAIANGEAPHTTSVLVMRGDATLYEAYFEGATAETLHDTRSVGKSTTGLAIGVAIDRDLLRLETRAFALLGTPAEGAKAAITVEDLLTMSSALDCDDDDPASPGNELRMYPLDRWRVWAAAIPPRVDYRRDATGRGPWHYCTAGVVLLGQILEVVAQQPADAFIAKAIFAPLGITRWEFERSPSGEVMTGGMLRLATRDLAKLGRAIHTGGAGLVSRAFVERATTEHRVAFAKRDETYGYLLWHRVHHTPCGDQEAWFMSGNGGNIVASFAKLDAVVVVTRTAYNSRGMHDQTKKLIDEDILPALCALSA